MFVVVARVCRCVDVPGLDRLRVIINVGDGWWMIDWIVGGFGAGLLDRTVQFIQFNPI